MATVNQLQPNTNAMKHIRIIAISIVFFIFGVAVSKVYDMYSRTTVDSLPFDQILANRDKINGKSVTVPGRVYADAGGNFWLVQSIGKEPYKAYAIQLTAWPFKQSPPIGTWSAYVEIRGRFSRRDLDSTYDDLLGPEQIVVREPPPGLETLQISPGDPFYDNKK